MTVLLLPVETELTVVHDHIASRPLSEPDVPFLVQLLSDPTIAWYEPLALPACIPAARLLVAAYVHKTLDSASTTRGWLIMEKGDPIGACQLRADGDGFLVGASLLPAARGRGIGTGVFRALAVHGLIDLHARHVAGEVEDGNIPSVRALQAASYTPTDRYQRTLDNGRQAMVTRYEVSR